MSASKQKGKKTLTSFQDLILPAVRSGETVAETQLDGGIFSESTHPLYYVLPYLLGHLKFLSKA